MNLSCAGISQQGHDTSGGGSTDDGIINEDDAFPADLAADGAQLDSHLIQPVILTGRDEGSADIFVFHQADAVGDSGGPGIAQGSVQAGIRNADDDIRVHRVGLCQYLACPDPGGVDADTLDDGILPGKVDMLKDAKPSWSRAAVAFVAGDSFGIDGQNLTGQNIPDKFRANGAEGTALRSHHIGSVLPEPIAQGTEPETNIQNNVVTQGLRLKAALDAINRDVDNDLREQAYEAVKGYYKTCEELCNKNEPLYDSLDWQDQEQYIYKLGNEIFDREEAAKPVTEASILDKVCDILNEDHEYEHYEQLDLDELIDLKDFYSEQMCAAVRAIRDYQKSTK